MFSKFRLMPALVALAFLISSCGSNAPKEARFIPKDASAVLILDPKNMEEKLEKSGISMDTLINHLFKRNAMDTTERSMFQSIKDSAGMDWSNKVFLFALQNGNANNGKSTAVNLIMGLKSGSEFEAFLKKQASLGDKKIQKEKDYTYLVTSSESMIAWDEKNVIGTFYQNEVKPYYDTVAMKFIVPEKGNTDSAMRAEVNRYFTQKKDASLASVDAFGKMFKDKADGYAFASTNSYLNVLSAMPLQLPKLEELVKDNYMAATLSFEEGKIVATTTTYTNPFVSNLLKRYAGPTVNLSLLEHYPSENINMIMMASFNPAIFGGILKELEVEGLVNSFMDKTGFSAQDLYKTLKGDIAVVVSDLGMPGKEIGVKNDSTISVSRTPIGKMIFTAPVGDTASFAKIMNKAVELGYFSKQGSTYKISSKIPSMGLYMQADEKNLIVASDSLTYAQYVSNKSKAVVGNDALNLFKGKSTVAYFDIANTIKGFMNSTGSNYQNSMSSAKNILKDVIATTDNFEDGAVKGKMEIRLNNEKQNSLATLTGLFTDIAVDMRMAAKKESEQSMFPSGVPAIIRTN